ncbi:MAG: sigma-70 family RNA polymerase sigma factor [Bacteroidetes bacterium]|nr:sigma-70 family RNA polymerase sigma factor [Bacteroidota bacterium]
MYSQTEQRKKLRNFFGKEYYNLLTYVKRYWRGDEETDPEDILQDVVLNLYTKVDLDTPIENLLAYTYRSLRNKIIDRQRKNKHRILSDFDDEENGGNHLLGKLQDNSPDPDEMYEKELMIESMFDLIGQLNPDQQEILIRTEIEGQTFESLSQEWEVPIGTLLSRKHRALSRLQKMFLEKNNN